MIDLRTQLAEAEKEDLLAAQAWLACRGIEPAEATDLQLLGALREVRLYDARIESAKALRWISGWMGRKE